MLSSLLPWEYFEQSCPLPPEGVTALCCYDPFIERMALSRIERQRGGTWQKISLKEVGNQWFENRFLCRGLFDQEESYLFLDAHEAQRPLKEKVLSMVEQMEKKCVLFVFQRREYLLEGLQKHPKVQIWNIKAPSPWQKDKLFDFLSAKMNLQLPSPVRTYLLDCVEEVQEIVNALKMIKIHASPGVPLTLELVKGLVKSARVDLFKLGHLYGERKFALFYGELLQQDFPYDEYRNLFSFLQGHLIKIYDPSYGANKEHRSRYDRRIEEERKEWPNREEIVASIQKMANLEIMAKEKNPLLQGKLRAEYVAFI